MVVQIEIRNAATSIGIPLSGRLNKAVRLSARFVDYRLPRP